MTCVVPGWGQGLWGTTPWAGSPGTIGGPLPTTPPFDIYCVGPCGPMATILTHPDVATTGQSNQFEIDPLTLDLIIQSGGAFPTDTATLTVNSAVPQTFTLDFTARFDKLPSNFSAITTEHILVSASDAAGPTFGLFFSKIGIAYTGSVHHDSFGNIVLDSPVQSLPNSQTLVTESEYFTFRIATDFLTQTTYIYVTATAQLNTTGHQLRYIMPMISSATVAQVPPDRTLLSVRGTVASPSSIYLDSLCLGSGLLIPNLPPRADSGLDQAVRTCSVVQLDGSKSFDPEGSTLLYRWRLLDAPPTSQYLFSAVDGLTYPQVVPTGFTDRLYSVSLGDANALDPLVAGDVLLVQGDPFVILSVGSDGFGFFARIEGYVLPDNLSSPTAFFLLRQRGLSGPTTVKPTFYPDVPGLYRFDLIVFDGSLYSTPAVVVLNVTESVVPRGCTPDIRFLWSYVSDFWKLVEDTERLGTLWGGMAQVAAAELLTLWQLEYSKSLRDIQRTFQRKWLRYDLLMREDPFRIEESTVRPVYGGLSSLLLPISGASGLHGQFLDISVTGGGTVKISISGAGLLPPAQLANQIQSQLLAFATGFTVSVLPNLAGTQAQLRIDAPFLFSIDGTSTLSLFSFGSNSFPQGTAGGAVATKTYRVEKSLENVGILDGDLLVLNGVGYRIARVTTEASDTFGSQRVVLFDELPATAPTEWLISGQATSKTLNFWAGLVSEGDEAIFEVLRLADGVLLPVSVPVLAACETATKTVGIDTSALGFFLSQPTLYQVFLSAVHRRQYIPIDPLVVDVPMLQEKIITTDEESLLRRNVDFFLEEYRGANAIRFVVGTPDVWQGVTPPLRMWAEMTYLDNRPLIEANFGLQADFTLDDLEALPDNIDYLSAVRGLWFAYLNGPTLFNLRAGVQILLGLPFAEEEGTIEEIRNDFSVTTGRILLRDTKNPEIVRAYSFPHALDLEINPATGLTYTVGDTVKQFAPLVEGVELVDYIKNPTWFEGYLQQGVFVEPEKLFKFLVRVDSDAFNLSALLFAKSFVLKVKPTYTYPLFVVIFESDDSTEVSVSDTQAYHGRLYTWAGPLFNGTMGVAQMWSQPRPGTGGWRSMYNTGPTGTPTFPTQAFPIVWGHDRGFLSPDDCILCKGTAVFAVDGPPTLDSIFSWGLPVYTAAALIFMGRWLFMLPAGTGTFIGDPLTVTTAGTLTDLTLEVDGDNGGHTTYELILTQNGADIATYAFNKNATGREVVAIAVSVPVLVGDVLRVRARPTGATNIEVYWHLISVQFGQAVPWFIGVDIPAGTYSSYRAL